MPTFRFGTLKVGSIIVDIKKGKHVLSNTITVKLL